MAQKQTPTNSDLLREIREVRDMQISQGQHIDTLLRWKEAQDIAKSAVDEYKRQEQSDRFDRQKKEILKQVGIVLGLVATVLYVYLQTKGIKP